MKKTLSILLASLSIFAFTACKSNTDASTNTNTTNTETSAKPAESSEKTITIGLLPDTDSVPFVIAEKQGYFKEAGVEVKIEQFKSAKDRDSALQAGKLDAVITDVLAVAFAKEGGFDVKITSKTDGNYKLLVGKDSGINSVADIKGKSIAISANTLIEYATDKLLEAANYTSQDVKKEAIPQIPTRLEMLQNGKIDSATLPEPMASLAMKNGAKLIDETAKHDMNPGVLAFSAASIKEKSAEIKAVYTAYNKAVEYINGTPVSDYVDLLIEKLGFPEDIKDSIALPEYKKAEMSKEKDVTDVLAWLKSKELIKGNYEFKDLIDDQFVR